MGNPFNPSFGKTPSVFLSRDLLKGRIITELNRENTPFQTSLIYGQRGAGKTTLMSSINKELQVSKEWIVIDLVLDDLLTSLIDQLNQHLIKLISRELKTALLQKKKLSEVFKVYLKRL